MPQGKGTYGSQVGRPSKKSSGFKLKSGNSPLYKNLGNSPVKQTTDYDEVPLTLEDRQASMDTIAAQRHALEKRYAMDTGETLITKTSEYQADAKAAARLGGKVSKLTKENREAAARSQERLIKGTKKVEKKSKTRKNFEKAFSAASTAGKKTFEFEGKTYTTKKK